MIIIERNYHEQSALINVSNEDFPPAIDGGYVYVIEAGGLVKVGSTKNIPRRLRNIETATGRHIDSLAVVGICVNYKLIESELLWEFKANKTAGEWLDACAEEVVFSLSRKHLEIVNFTSKNWTSLKERLAEHAAKRQIPESDLCFSKCYGIFETAQNESEKWTWADVTVTDWKSTLGDTLEKYSSTDVGKALDALGVAATKPMRINGKMGRYRRLPIRLL